MESVPAASLASKSATLPISAVGTAAQTTTRTVIANPDMALTRFRAFQALPKIEVRQSSGDNHERNECLVRRAHRVAELHGDKHE